MSGERPVSVPVSPEDERAVEETLLDDVRAVGALTAGMDAATRESYLEVPRSRLEAFHTIAAEARAADTLREALRLIESETRGHPGIAWIHTIAASSLAGQTVEEYVTALASSDREELADG